MYIYIHIYIHIAIDICMLCSYRVEVKLGLAVYRK